MNALNAAMLEALVPTSERSPASGPAEGLGRDTLKRTVRRQPTAFDARQMSAVMFRQQVSNVLLSPVEFPFRS
jgi:hypothetical protein